MCFLLTRTAACICFSSSEEVSSPREDDAHARATLGATQRPQDSQDPHAGRVCRSPISARTRPAEGERSPGSSRRGPAALGQHLPGGLPTVRQGQPRLLHFSTTAALKKKINATSSSKSSRGEASISPITAEPVLAPTQPRSQPLRFPMHPPLPPRGPQRSPRPPTLPALLPPEQLQHLAAQARNAEKRRAQETPRCQWAGEPRPAHRSQRALPAPSPTPRSCRPPQKDRPVLELLIAKLFGRKRKV